MTDLIVTIEDGQLKGKKAVDYRGGNFISFLGIPYGKPPVGELRFRAPQPAEPWEGVRDATKDGTPCPALDMYFLYFVGKEEDCLNLNVHTRELPKDSSTKLKPVMFWIHGGAYLYGSNLNELFGPDFLMTEDIVLVSINYRLGALGFLALEDPSLKIPGNAGLKDMVLALKWVQKNISKFGGDPNNVTVFGESAGAASVHFLLLSPLCKGLFHKAIIQSGCALNPWAKGKHNAVDIAKGLGYSETDEKTIYEKLMKESAKTIVKAVFKAGDPFLPNKIRPFAPVVENSTDEDAFLTEEPIHILNSGTFIKVPIIMGYNTKEGMLFEIVRKTRPNVKISKNLENEIPYELNLEKGSEKSVELANKISKFYFDNQEIDEDCIDTVYTLKSDNQFNYGILKAVALQKQHTVEPIYIYRMSLDGPLNFFKKFCGSKHIKTLFLCLFLSRLSVNYPTLKKMFHSLGNLVPTKIIEGVSHADDLGYLFTTFCTPKIAPDSKEDAHIRRFVKLWTNFARCGNPTPDGNDETFNKVTWLPTKEQELTGLDIGEDLSCDILPENERIKFWNDIYNEYSKL